MSVLNINFLSSANTIIEAAMVTSRGGYIDPIISFKYIVKVLYFTPKPDGINDGKSHISFLTSFTVTSGVTLSACAPEAVDHVNTGTAVLA